MGTIAPPVSPEMNTAAAFRALGPGVIYAAGAVGVSHLVQATRAGAGYGLVMVLVVVLAGLLKYPAMRFGSEYAGATGKSLVQGYRESHRAAFWLFAASQLLSMVFIVAAVALFTAGLIQTAFDFTIAPTPAVGMLLGAVGVALITGSYRLLERMAKVVIAALVLMLLAAVVLVIPRLDWSLARGLPLRIDREFLIFAIALSGLMPTSLDGSVLQSLWTCEKATLIGRASRKAVAFDFNVGYVTSLLLAAVFVFLGSVLIYQPGLVLGGNNAAYAAALLGLFTTSFGAWSYPFVAATAVLVMLSTLFAVLDGMTRLVLAIAQQSLSAAGGDTASRWHYAAVLACLAAASTTVVATLMESFATFIDTASIILFLVAPLLAWLNHGLMFGRTLPLADRPGPWMRRWSAAGVALMALVSAAYLLQRFAG